MLKGRRRLAICTCHLSDHRLFNPTLSHMCLVMSFETWLIQNSDVVQGLQDTPRVHRIRATDLKLYLRADGVFNMVSQRLLVLVAHIVE